nr:hypothetical transcript [Hymenolepis microstoma]
MPRNLATTLIAENREADEEDDSDDDDDEKKSKGIEVLSLPKQLEELVVNTGKDDEVSKQCLGKAHEHQAKNDMRNALQYFTYSLFYAKSENMKREAFFARGNLFQQLNYFDAALSDLKKADNVGFCNAQCEKYAKHEGTSYGTGPGRHTYECHGILPYLLIDQISSRQERDPSYTGCVTTCHLAYRSIADTPQKTLIDYITHSGCYKNNGHGHQAFETSTVVRRVPPPRKFMSTDYSSVAWLDPCTERRSRIELWQKTMAAVFLTYCLSVSGYTMSWYGDDFYSAPEADLKPEVIPASWTKLDERLKLHEKGDSLVAMKDYYNTVSRMVMKCGNIKQYNSDFANCKTDFERNLATTLIAENREADEEDDSDDDDDEKKSKGIEVLSLPKQLEELVVNTGKDDEVSKQCLGKAHEHQAKNDMRNALQYFTYSLFYAKSENMKREAFFARGNLFQQLNYFDAALSDLKKADNVGFCNAQCEKYAKHEGTSYGTGPGRHTYECHGILPYLLIDQISSRQERDPSYTGCVTTCHLAYRSIADTPQKTLIDYITHSGCYKNNGHGHQAFETSTVVRRVPPPRKFMSTDYSSVAWLDPCTERRSRIELWQKTMAAVFLTYCLSVSGYTMSWYGDDFYSAPEADLKPEVIPASWTKLDERLKLHEKGDSLVAMKDYYNTVSRMVMKCGNIKQYNSDFANCKTDFERNLATTLIAENREADEEDDSDDDDDEKKSKGIEVLSLPKQLEELVVNTGKDDEVSKQCLGKAHEHQAKNDMRNALQYFTYSLFYAKSENMKREAFFARGNLFQQLNYFDAALSDLKKADNVGFCNAQCEKYAKHEGTSYGTGPGRHTYECHGILPYLLIDQISSRQERDPSYTGCVTTCHLAYRSIADTPQKTLIDYITHSGCYKNNGHGHQAFETSTVVRRVPPPRKFMSTDYSSVAWLDPCTERRSRIELWQKTMAAVFLTYCLSVSGYTMSWYGDDFYSAPEADLKPEVIPASWRYKGMARLAVKSKYNAEFRRFRLDRSHVQRFEDLYHAVEKAHSLQNNCERALSVASDLLRLLIQLKGESYGEIKGYKSSSAVFLRKKPAELVRSLGSERIKPGHQSIILCDDFHKVSSIIDDGTVPECMRKYASSVVGYLCRLL